MTLRPSRRRITVAALVVLGASAGIYAVTAGGGAEAQTTTARATSTATVASKDLVVTEDLDGTLGFGADRELSAHRTGVVTSMTAEGKIRKQGRTLYSIDQEPTVLLTGSVPAYRALSTSSSKGRDIKQLEKALATMGYGSNLVVDRKFTSATASAVEAWEKDLGRSDPDGTVEFGDVVFAPGPVRVGTQTSPVGTSVQDTSAVMAVSSTTKVVNIDLDASRSDIVAVKDAVSVTLPDGKKAAGTITSIGTQPELLSGSDTETVPVAVALKSATAAADFDSGEVTVTIERSRDDDVLAVPVTALVALAEGGYALPVVDSGQPNGYRLVAVKVGTIAGDNVGITGDGVTAGTEVVVPA